MANGNKGKCGGKGNIGMFIEREPRICAAGIASAQPNEHVGDSLQHYLLKDKVDALLNDAILPPEKPRPLPPLRRPMPKDMRNAGPFGEVPQLVNPPVKTKFQSLIEDFKNTSYTSYWNKVIGQVRDPIPMLPEGFDMHGTTFGKKSPFHVRLYDVIMPKVPIHQSTPLSKLPGIQISRKYCEPPFNQELTYGRRSFIDKRGRSVKCCLTDDNKILGKGDVTTLTTIQSDYKEKNHPKTGTVLAPYNNESNVPFGHAFGKLKPRDNLPECLSFCSLNPDRIKIRQCIGHLNSLRKCLSTRLLPTFFRDFYSNLKYLDTNKRKWLLKDVVYNMCASKFIRFDQSLIEPLLLLWNAFNGNEIQYETFVHMINYRQHFPDIPKIPDVSDDCLDFRTTYTEMVKPNQEIDLRRMAGLPSGRYFDLDYPITPEECCRADRTCLPHESDAKSCLAPSVLTLLHVNHRDMYAKREPDIVKKVFKPFIEHLSNEKFEEIWGEAQKYHSKGWVCYETFRRALDKHTKK